MKTPGDKRKLSFVISTIHSRTFNIQATRNGEISHCIKPDFRTKNIYLEIFRLLKHCHSYDDFIPRPDFFVLTQTEQSRKRERHETRTGDEYLRGNLLP